ncbi:hypothetical protein JVT61DRAFT_7281 [Boletus reticuloceps]|uniref:Peptidase M16 C-terminal domain-containing protein n=1 Tax=Boletus reticuloceps TaxID=495285 RepID=A0A8I2YIC6_9AGAM|nr:hypothetical protein JVT61DRAFT_7281 [Boletus reticuloceps]
MSSCCPFPQSPVLCILAHPCLCHLAIMHARAVAPSSTNLKSLQLTLLGDPCHIERHRSLVAPAMSIQMVGLITGDLLRHCTFDWYCPDCMVIAGAGMQHEQLVEPVDRHFSTLKPLPSSTATLSTVIYSSNSSSYLYPTSTSRDVPSPLNPLLQYVGGVRHIPSTATDFNHLYLTLEGIGIHDNTLVMILEVGAASQQSWKGNVFRLYTHILNHFPQIDHCASFHHIYTDPSLDCGRSLYLTSRNSKHHHSLAAPTTSIRTVDFAHPPTLSIRVVGLSLPVLSRRGP